MSYANCKVCGREIEEDHDYIYLQHGERTGICLCQACSRKVAAERRRRDEPDGGSPPLPDRTMLAQALNIPGLDICWESGVPVLVLTDDAIFQTPDGQYYRWVSSRCWQRGSTVEDVRKERVGDK